MNRGGLIVRFFNGSRRLCLAVGLTLTLTACLSPEEKCLNAMREAVYADDFAKGLATADAFYRRHAVETEHPSEQAMALRWEISAYTRLCLLMTGELNNRFLAYYPVREMGILLPAPLPLVNQHCYAYARLYCGMGLYGPALPVVLWHAEDLGWDKAGVNLLFEIYTNTRQYRVAQTYLQAFQKNAKTRRWSKPWVASVTAMAETASAPDGTQTQPLSSAFLTGPQSADESFIDGYVKAVFRYGTAQGDTAKPNPYLTDYYTLLCLLEKNLAQVPLLLNVYQRQARPIPGYLQEAALIYASGAGNAARLEASGLTREALQLSPDMERRVAKVFQDFEMLKIGALPFDEMTRRHAATYTYHFLFGQIQ